MNGVGYVGEGSTLATLANLAMGRVGEGGRVDIPTVGSGLLRIVTEFRFCITAFTYINPRNACPWIEGDSYGLLMRFGIYYVVNQSTNPQILPRGFLKGHQILKSTYQLLNYLKRYPILNPAEKASGKFSSITEYP